MSTPLVQAEAWCKITFPFETTSLNGMFSPIVLESRDFFWINLRLTEIPCQSWCSNPWPTVSCTFYVVWLPLRPVEWFLSLIHIHLPFLSIFMETFIFIIASHTYSIAFSILSVLYDLIGNSSNHLEKVSKVNLCLANGHSNGEAQHESPCSRHVLVAGTADVLLLCWMLCTFNMGESVLW